MGMTTRVLITCIYLPFILYRVIYHYITIMIIIIIIIIIIKPIIIIIVRRRGRKIRKTR